MILFERILLKVVQGFQDLTTEEKERYLILFKHKFIASFFTYLFTNSMIPNLISIVLCTISFVLCITCNKIIVNIVAFTILPIAAFVTIINIIIIYKSKIKNNSYKEIKNWFIKQIQNLWLLNPTVISFKDWKIIKKRNKTLYDNARSENCNQKCYFTSYAIANTLENPNIKILWISVQSTNNYKCGHSVLVKNDKIYDSNLRRTYNREKYLKAFKAEVFKEYSFEEYMNKVNLQKKHFSFLDWEEFGKWCKTKNVIRDS